MLMGSHKMYFGKCFILKTNKSFFLESQFYFFLIQASCVAALCLCFFFPTPDSKSIKKMLRTKKKK